MEGKLFVDTKGNVVPEGVLCVSDCIVGEWKILIWNLDDTCFCWFFTAKEAVHVGRCDWLTELEHVWNMLISLKKQLWCDMTSKSGITSQKIRNSMLSMLDNGVIIHSFQISPIGSLDPYESFSLVYVDPRKIQIRQGFQSFNIWNTLFISLWSPRNPICIS